MTDTDQPEAPDIPAGAYEAVEEVASMLGMDAPAPALGERPAAATELTEDTRIQLARAMYDSVDRCARCKVCEHQIGAAAKVAGEAVRAEKARAEAAEAKLSAIAAYIEEHKGDAGLSLMHAGDILAVVSSDKKAPADRPCGCTSPDCTGSPCGEGWR